MWVVLWFYKAKNLTNHDVMPYDLRDCYIYTYLIEENVSRMFRNMIRMVVMNWVIEVWLEYIETSRVWFADRVR